LTPRGITNAVRMTREKSGIRVETFPTGTINKPNKERSKP
jgi:hypothetical protein